MFILTFLFQTIFLHCIEQHEGEVTFSETQKLARKQKQHFCRVERPCWLMGFTRRESCAKITQKCEQMCQPPGDHDAAQVSAALQHCGQLQGCGDRLHQVWLHQPTTILCVRPHSNTDAFSFKFGWFFGIFGNPGDNLQPRWPRWVDPTQLVPLCSRFPPGCFHWPGDHGALCTQIRAKVFPSYSQVEKLYRAMRTFDDLMNSEENHIRLKMKPGDMVTVKNKRVMHGRSG